MICLETLKMLILSFIRCNVDIFLYSGSSGILSSDGKQNTANAGARGVRTVALSISFHVQTQ